MVSEEIDKELIDEICFDLEFYDQNGYLPKERIRIDVTLSRRAINKLSNIKNKSKYIERKIFS